MSIDKLQGLRVTCATIDEWLSGDIREDVVGTLEQSAAKEQNASGNNDYLILAISSEGTVRNGAGDTVKMELMKILKENMRIFIRPSGGTSWIRWLKLMTLPCG